MTKLFGYHLPNEIPAKAGDPVELVAMSDGKALVEVPLFDVPPPTGEPSSCTGVAHTHRWMRFGKNGERDDMAIDVDAAGLITLSEQAFELLAREAGFGKHDPSGVESAAARRLEWARSRLQDALNRRAR